MGPDKAGRSCFQDLIADIQAPAAVAAASAAARASGGAVSSCAYLHRAARDSLSKISKEIYGDANKYMKIFDANKEQAFDPDKLRAGIQLVIP